MKGSDWRMRTEKGGRGYIQVPRHQCTGARYGKTCKRGSRRNEEIGLRHAQGENEKCRNWHRKYRNRQNHVRIHSTRMPRPSSRFSTVNSWDPLSLLIHSFSRSRRCTMSVGAFSRTVTRQEWSQCVTWTAMGVCSLFLMEERWPFILSLNEKPVSPM